ncbi:MAG: oligosaccharide flippase family protein [Flavisolibacter sp.]
MLRKLKNSLFSDFIIYGLGSVISRSIGLILTPFLAHALLPHEFGIINLANTTAYFIGIFVVFSLDAAAGRWFFDTNEEAYRKSTIANWFWFQFLACVAVALLAFLFADPLSRLIFLEKGNTWFFLLPILSLPFNAFAMVFQNLERFRKRPVSVTVFNIALTAMNVVFILFFLMVAKKGVMGYFLGQFITVIILALYALIRMHDWIHPKNISFSMLRHMLRFSLPMVPTAIAFWLLNSSAVYFLNYILKNKTEVGLFGVGASIAALISLVTTSFQQAWGVYFMSIYQEKGTPARVSRIANGFVIVSFLLWLFICLYTPEFLVLFTRPSYYAAAWVPCILSLGPIVYSFAYFTQVGCYVEKNMKPFATGVLLSGFLSVVFYFLLIPSFGKEGAALATVAGQLLIPIYLYIRGNKYYPVRYNIRLVASIIATALVIGLGGRMIEMHSMFALALVKLGLMIVYLLICLKLVAIFDKTSYQTLVFYFSKAKLYLNVRNSRRHVPSQP